MWFYNQLPDDAPGGDCPLHGPYSESSCPKCLQDQLQVTEWHLLIDDREVESDQTSEQV